MDIFIDIKKCLYSVNKSENIKTSENTGIYQENTVRTAATCSQEFPAYAISKT